MLSLARAKCSNTIGVLVALVVVNSTTTAATTYKETNNTINCIILFEKMP